MSKHTEGEAWIGKSEDIVIDGKVAHEGIYVRENNGDWIIMVGPRDEAQRLCTVSMRAEAKRGKGWQTPDPEGFANAERLVALWNARA
jgi:hypothetical protein